MADESQVKPERQRGLFTGFEHFATPTDADYRAVISGGLVVLDTNALLNLYRYSMRPRKALLEILAKIGDHLWEPQQVMAEFWRNREKALQDYAAASSAFEKQVTGARDQTVKAINECAKRFGIDVGQRKNLIDAVEGAYEKLSTRVKSLVASDGTAKVGRDTGADSVLSALDSILRGRVGEPYGVDEYNAALDEARRRIDAQIPPAFKDSSKEPGRAEGDYLVWSQILDEAARRQTDVLFVTGDVKEDWWRDAGPVKQVGPRMELLQEFRDRTGARLLMLQPADFLDKAGSILEISVAVESVEQAREVDLEQQDRSAPYLIDNYKEVVTKVLQSPIFRAKFLVRAAGVDSGIDFNLYKHESRNAALGIVVLQVLGTLGEFAMIRERIEAAERFLTRSPRHKAILVIVNRDLEELVSDAAVGVDNFYFYEWSERDSGLDLYEAVSSLYRMIRE